MFLSASSIIGDSVKNPEGEDLGKIEDLMVDTNSADISYAVISFGGFLGMGDKLFAVPLEAMQVDTENHNLVLDVSKEKLENAPGFDKDNWPRNPDQSFINEVNSYYQAAH